MPKVSIIIPTYNREAFLAETLESISNQTFNDWECVVVDDGSTDGTPELMTQIVRNDARFVYLHRPAERKKGANACRNYGFEVCKGEFVKWFDSDDLMHEDMLRSQVALLESDAELDFVACLGYTFKGSRESLEPLDADTEREEGRLVYNYIVKNLYFLTSVPLWRRRFLIDKKLFDETLSRGQEYDFHFRMITQNPKYIYATERLYFKRDGNADSITTNALRNKKAQLSVIRVFDVMYDAILEMPQSQMRSDLLKHLAYRQLIHVFSLKVYCGAAVFEFYSETSDVVFKIITTAKLGFLRNLKILAGNVTVAFGKGYRLFHYPEFDLAKQK